MLKHASQKASVMPKDDARKPPATRPQSQKLLEHSKAIEAQDGGGTQSGLHPAKTQSKVMRHLR